ncbi:MAG TPA: CBS domain-containing protein [Candidatus Saccharimonadales bacterium]|nr:CBS domain-containing protein [Candidatus Saccharimonadales bacterium]
MNDYILAAIFLLLAVGGVVVRKTYNYIPAHELKRRAEHHDPLASRLYPAVAYGSSLRVLLWLYIGLMTAATIILLARALPVWASLLIVGPLLWAAFSWLPASRVTVVGARLTVIVTPFITGLLNYLHPLLGRSSMVVHNHAHIQEHTGLFERGDLIELIEQQQRQPDSRLSEEELEAARRALNFSEYKVSDVLVPRKAIKTILAKDTVGPVLIDELHKNGLGYVLVRDGPKDEFVGSLAFKSLDLHSNGKVHDFMDKGIYYVHADDSLNQALHAFFTTHQPLFIVVNSFEEYVGIITIEGIIKQLLGHVPGDDFESYHHISAVARRHPKPEKAKPAKTTKKKEDQAEKPNEENGGAAEEPEAKPEESKDTPVKTDGKVVE